MRTARDEEIVDAWLDPVSLPDMLSMLREAGFSGDVYRGCFGDLNANLEDDEAGALHFLRHGYAEGRIFRTGLDLAGLSRLRQLPVHNRVYLQNLLVALVTAWTGTNIRSAVDVAAYDSTIEQFGALGGVPLVILGDVSAGLYRRGVSSRERWICPLAMAPLKGIEALLRTEPHTLLAPRRDAGRDAMPTIWKFGQSDMQAGYLAHRLRHAIGPGDMEAFVAFAASVIKNYAALLAAAVPVQERPEHWIASLFPPVWQAAELQLPVPGLVAEFGSDVMEMIAAAGPDRLLDLTMMHELFNTRLERTVTELGFSVVRDFDCFLTAHGVIDEHYMVATKDSAELDYGITRGIISTSLWNIVNGHPAGAPSGGIREQFEHLLQEIRLVQAGQSG